MPQRKIIKASDLSGLFIYQDPKRGTIFYDVVTKKGYILTSSDVKIYTIYSAMLPMCIIVSAGILSMFSMNYASALIVFIAMFILYESLFRAFFFYKLPVAENWHPIKKESLHVTMARGFSKQRLIILIVLLLLLSVMMPLYAIVENMQGINLYCSYIVGFLTLTGAIISIMALVTKIKNNY